jgi:hypothetical protein
MIGLSLRKVVNRAFVFESRPASGAMSQPEKAEAAEAASELALNAAQLESITYENLEAADDVEAAIQSPYYEQVTFRRGNVNHGPPSAGYYEDVMVTGGASSSGKSSASSATSRERAAAFSRYGYDPGPAAARSRTLATSTVSPPRSSSGASSDHEMETAFGMARR